MKPEPEAIPPDPAGKRCFLFDLGFHHGEGLAYLTDLYQVDRDWTVFAFEPNSKCRAHLRREQMLQRTNFIPMPFAAADSAGRAEFQRETGGAGREDGEGSHLAEIDFAVDPKGAGLEEVWKIDFPAFLCAVLPAEREGTFTVVKMDIEGAEYAVLRSLLETGVIDRINVLHVEFHQRLMDSETDESTGELKQALERRLKLVEHW